MATKPFAQTNRFYGHFGWFYSTWLATEVTIDWAIGKILKIPPEQTHAMVAGLQMSRKAALLRSLLPKSDYTNVSELKGLLTRIRKQSLRNVFSHSFIFSNPDTVTFIHRSVGDDYSAKAYHFRADEFVAHVKNFVQLAVDFEKALAITHAELEEFTKAALPEKT